MCKHMTVEELNSLNPSLEKPVELEGILTLPNGQPIRKSFTVVSNVVNGRFIYINPEFGNPVMCHDVIRFLRDYKSFKQPNKIKLFRYTCRFKKDNRVKQSEWTSQPYEKELSAWLDLIELIKTEEKEIEVD